MNPIRIIEEKKMITKILKFMELLCVRPNLRDIGFLAEKCTTFS